ncbi:MAG TPA: DUF1801 domain-containing protein [Ktedonobacterales bacterium]|nr:DUF1801 domain-containing protein [Ktedonobacterales bacterium]
MANKQLITTVDAYISGFPAHVQANLTRVRATIREAAPEAVETMSYGIPTFDLAGKHLVFFAGWKRHISLYPLPAGDDAYQQRIAQYKRVKSTVQFPLDKPIPYDLIRDTVALLQRERPDSGAGRIHNA